METAAAGLQKEVECSTGAKTLQICLGRKKKEIRAFFVEAGEKGKTRARRSTFPGSFLGSLGQGRGDVKPGPPRSSWPLPAHPGHRAQHIPRG